jgi:uncharacterized membrane protein YdjX (TVP38/TMEM64 family)
MSHRAFALVVWLALLAAGILTVAFQRDALARLFSWLSTAPLWWGYAVYLVLGCLRGFTLVPATYLVVAGMIVLPPWPLYALTVVGIVVSSTAVYYFAAAMQFDRFFEKRYASQIARLRVLMARRQLPVVLAWSFFPAAPTDLVVYVCGVLKIDLKKCLFGVAVGEGAICAIYIFLGGQALDWLR